MPDLLPHFDADGAGGASPPRRCYSVHGVPVDVTAGEPALLERAHAMLQHLGLAPREAPVAGDAVVLRLSEGPGRVRLPADARPAAEEDGIRAWSTGEDRLSLECDGHAARLDLAAGAGEYVLPPSPVPPREELVVHALLLLLRRRGLFGLHASGVSRGGTGWLFVAEGGSGASAQADALVRQGWGYLGGDTLLLRSGPDAVEALALRRDLLRGPPLPGAYPEPAGGGDAVPAGATGKRRIAVPELYPDRLTDACVPRVLVFPEIVPAPRSRLVPLDRANTLLRLMARSAALRLDAEPVPHHLNVLDRLAAQARSYRLLAGRDLDERPELVATLLAAAAGPEDATTSAADPAR